MINKGIIFIAPVHAWLTIGMVGRLWLVLYGGSHRLMFHHKYESKRDLEDCVDSLKVVAGCFGVERTRVKFTHGRPD